MFWGFLFILLHDWQGKVERRTLAWLRFDPNTPSVPLDNFAAN
jgi:hypothetical protein